MRNARDIALGVDGLAGQRGGIVLRERAAQRLDGVEVDRGKREPVPLPPRDDRRQEQRDLHPARGSRGQNPPQGLRRRRTSAHPSIQRGDHEAGMPCACLWATGPVEVEQAVLVGVCGSRPREVDLHRPGCREVETTWQVALGADVCAGGEPPGHRVDDDRRLIDTIAQSLLKQRLGLLEQCGEGPVREDFDGVEHRVAGPLPEGQTQPAPQDLLREQAGFHRSHGGDDVDVLDVPPFLEHRHRHHCPHR